MSTGRTKKLPLGLSSTAAPARYSDNTGYKAVVGVLAIAVAGLVVAVIIVLYLYCKPKGREG